MKKRENDFIKNFSEDRKITSKFLIKNKEIKTSKNNNQYLELTLQDKTGQIPGRIFNKVKKEYDRIEVGSIRNIIGRIQEYPKDSGKYSIKIDESHPSKKYDENDFFKSIENFEAHKNFLNHTIKEVDDKELSYLLRLFFSDESFVNKFIRAPAAKTHHHNYEGGLLVHTNEVIKICKTISDIYDGIDRNLLLTGAILHDIGKVETYNYETKNIEINNNGYMLDHLYIGASMVEEKIRTTKISDKTKTKVIHMILSHHGDVELGWGSAVSPKTLEALALHYADDMSAKITAKLEKF